MEPQNILDITRRAEFRTWLQEHAGTEIEFWLTLKMGKPGDEQVLYYLDAVEEALCFGWIDGVGHTIDGVHRRRFTPRRPKSNWTELNKERVRRLEKLGLMTDAGRIVLPEMDTSKFIMDTDVKAALKAVDAWEIFCSFPPLYQRIRAYNVAFYKGRKEYEKALANMLAKTAARKMYGEWNGYGRLLNY